jgi:hypothetical protein
MFENFRFPHSAEVLMWLDCGDRGQIHLSRIAPKYVVTTEEVDIPAGDADLVVVVDGDEMRTRVHVADSSRGRVARVHPVDQVAPF